MTSPNRIYVIFWKKHPGFKVNLPGLMCSEWFFTSGVALA